MTTPEQTRQFFELHRELKELGEQTMRLEEWRSLGLRAILLGTASGAEYVIETTEPHCLVTRLKEKQPIEMENDGVIFRREANPDNTITIGQRHVNMWGLARGSDKFSPDDMYYTTDVMSIAYLL